MVGILDVSESRDPRLEETGVRTTIEQALNDIIDRPIYADRETQFERYGLKAPKIFKVASEPALDTARIESFRERLEILQQQKWEVRRGMSITASHWMIFDVEKFNNYLALIKEKIDFLIGLMGVEDRVNRAMRHDIRALGWHPVFGKSKAFSDMSKLRLIKEACAVDYPAYAEATEGALEYLDKEWKDSYQEAMERPGESGPSEIPGVAAYMMAQSQQLTAAYARPKSSSGSKSGFLHLLRPKSWRKSSRDESERGRSMSHTPVSNTAPLTPPMSPDSVQQRSKSIAVPQSHDPELPYMPAERRSEDNMLSKIDTAKSAVGTTVGPVTSMISRHDMFKDEKRV